MQILVQVLWAKSFAAMLNFRAAARVLPATAACGGITIAVAVGDASTAPSDRHHAGRRPAVTAEYPVGHTAPARSLQPSRQAPPPVHQNIRFGGTTSSGTFDLAYAGAQDACRRRIATVSACRSRNALTMHSMSARSRTPCSAQPLTSRRCASLCLQRHRSEFTATRSAEYEMLQASFKRQSCGTAALTGGSGSPAQSSCCTSSPVWVESWPGSPEAHVLRTNLSSIYCKIK